MNIYTSTPRASYPKKRATVAHRFLLPNPMPEPPQHRQESGHSSTSSNGWGPPKTAARQEKPPSVKEKRPPPAEDDWCAQQRRPFGQSQQQHYHPLHLRSQFRREQPPPPAASEQQKRLQNTAAKPDEYVELIAQCEANPGKFLGTQYCLRLVLGTQPLEEFIRQRAWGKEQLKEWDITTDWQAYERKLGATDETSPSPTTTGNTSTDAVVVVNNADNGDDVGNGNDDEPSQGCPGCRKAKAIKETVKMFIKAVSDPIEKILQHQQRLNKHNNGNGDEPSNSTGGIPQKAVLEWNSDSDNGWGKAQPKESNIATERKLATDKTTRDGTSADAVVVVNNDDSADEPTNSEAESLLEYGRVY